jgi:hypothetical protein
LSSQKTPAHQPHDQSRPRDPGLCQSSTSDQIRGNSPTLGGPSHGVNPDRPTSRTYTARSGTFERVSHSGADRGPAKPSPSVVLPPWRRERGYTVRTPG